MLRVALAQVDLTVGDLAGNAAVLLDRTAEAARPEPSWSCSPRWRSPATRPRTWSCARRSARRLEPPREAGRRLAERGFGELAVVVGYVGDDAGPRNALAFCLGGQVVATLLQAPPAELRRVRRAPLLRPGRPTSRRPLPRRRHRADDLRGRVAGRRPVHGGRSRRGRAGREHQRLAVRAQQGRRAAAAAAAAGRRGGRPVAYVNTVGGQDELVFDGDSMVVGADGAVLLRAPQFVEGVYVVDLELPLAESAGPAPSTGWTADDRESARPATPPAPIGRLRRARWPTGSATRPRCGARWSPGLRDYVVRTASARVVLGMSGGIDSAVVAAVAADAIGGDRTSTASRCPATTRPSTPGPTPPTSPDASARTTGSCPSRRWSTRSSAALALPAWPRRTSRPGCAAPR